MYGAPLISVCVKGEHKTEQFFRLELSICFIYPAVSLYPLKLQAQDRKRRYFKAAHTQQRLVATACFSVGN